MSATHRSAHDELQRVRLEQRQRRWPFWLLALLALAVAAWLTWRGMRVEGDLVRVRFDHAAGIEAGETRVTLRGVVVGRVESVSLAEDRGSVWLGVRLQPGIGELPAKTQFRIVRASFELGNMQHLDTLLAGPRIEMEFGEGPPADEFDARQLEPALEQDDGVLTILLLALEAGNVGENTPILYRGIEVGRVLDLRLENDSRAVRMRARIDERHAPLIRMDTRFWRAGEIGAQVGLGGLQLDADSLGAMFTGAIALASPDSASPPARNGTAFRLYDQAQAEWLDWFPEILLIDPDRAAAQGSAQGARGGRR